MTETGKYARDYFKHGELRHIKRLKFWPLETVLLEKYKLPEHEVGIGGDIGGHEVGGGTRCVGLWGKGRGGLSAALTITLPEQEMGGVRSCCFGGGEVHQPSRILYLVSLPSCNPPPLFPLGTVPSVVPQANAGVLPREACDSAADAPAPLVEGGDGGNIGNNQARWRRGGAQRQRRSSCVPAAAAR